MHWKTQLALKLNLGEVDGFARGGGSDEAGYTFSDKNNEGILHIPMEAQEFLDMATRLIGKANAAIINSEKKKNGKNS